MHTLEVRTGPFCWVGVQLGHDCPALSAGQRCRSAQEATAAASFISQFEKSFCNGKRRGLHRKKQPISFAGCGSWKKQPSPSRNRSQTATWRESLGINRSKLLQSGANVLYSLQKYFVSKIGLCAPIGIECRTSKPHKALAFKLETL